MWTGRARVPAVALTIALAVGLTLAAAPSPLVSGPRPAISTRVPVGDRTTPPPAHVDVRFATLPFTSVDGVPGVWKLTQRALPLEFTVEREVAERYDPKGVREALAVWNETDGSDFEATLTAVTEEGVDRRQRDGVNRIFLDRRSCGERFLARAHLWPAEKEVRGDSSVAWIEEVDIGICERLDRDRLPWVLRHEIGHVIGLGHLCDYGSECWLPEMSPDNHCRVMSPASYVCQELTAADRDGLVYMHPAVGRVAGPGPVGTAAAASYHEFPAVQQAEIVLATAVTADPDLQAAASVLAAVLDAPHLVVDEQCTEGPEGQELNRVATQDARVLLVGDVTDRCLQNLNGGWLVAVERLPDLDAVTTRLTDAIGPPATVVLVPRHDENDRRIPASVLAAPVAAALGAPLLVTDHRELSPETSRALDRLGDVRVAVVFGSVVNVRSAVTDALHRRGVRVRRIDATDRFTLAAKVSRMRDVFGFEPIRVVLAAQLDLDDAAAVSTMAARHRAAVIPLGGNRSQQALDLIEERAGEAIVVGDHFAVPYRLQSDASRRIDRP